MEIAPLLANEESRLACLYKYDILDSEAETDFDEIVQLASRVCQTPISMISLVDDHRQWFKSRLGVDVQETPRDPAFCAHALLGDEIMEVPDATRDRRFFDNPFVTGSPDIRFYAGMPLTMADGSRLGTLCVIDRHPRHLSEGQRTCLRILGKQVVHLLELRLKIKELNQALKVVEEQKGALQKLNQAGNRVLSVIGHDVRSPLATLVTLLDLCEMKEVSPTEYEELLKEIRAGTVSAIDLLSDLIEWAENQFEGGTLKVEELAVLEVVDEEINGSRATFERKENQVNNLVAKEATVQADRHAVAFMVRNLLLNANKFTEKGTISVTADKQDGKISVSVTDSGIGMTTEQLAKLFDSTLRGSTTRGTRGEKGSGLGLQMCKQFAEKQGGTLGAESTPGKGSRFYFTLPVGE